MIDLFILYSTGEIDLSFLFLNIFFSFIYLAFSFSWNYWIFLYFKSCSAMYRSQRFWLSLFNYKYSIFAVFNSLMHVG